MHARQLHAVYREAQAGQRTVSTSDGAEYHTKRYTLEFVMAVRGITIFV